MGSRLQVGALGSAAFPTLAQWFFTVGFRPGDPEFAFSPPTSAGTDAAVDDLIKTLNLWYLVILVAIPVLIAAIPLFFPQRWVAPMAALLLSLGCAYTVALADRFMSWGFGLGWGTYSTFGPGLIAYAVCYAISAGMLLIAAPARG